MPDNKKATLILQNGIKFHGVSFGAPISATGEVVFNTTMIGSPQVLTSPSCAGQIVVMTYPLIGNYGVPEREMLSEGVSKHFESEKIHARAVIVADYSEEYSHWDAVNSQSEWLKEQGVPAIYGVDTREITKIIREGGVLSGKVVVEGSLEPKEFEDPYKTNIAATVGCKEVLTYGKGALKVVVVDCGCDHSIIRALLKYDTTVVRVPAEYDICKMEYDGVVIGTGPGDPNMCRVTIENIRKAMELNRPILGIGLGHQLLALAAGAQAVKLKVGHRGQNHPVLMVGTDSAAITTQNNGYIVDKASLNNQWEETFVSLNDDTNQGIKHKTKPFASIQFHSEACTGAATSDKIIGGFIENIKKSKQ